MRRNSRKLGINAIDLLLKQAQSPERYSLPPDHPVADLARSDLARLRKILPEGGSPLGEELFNIGGFPPMMDARGQYYRQLQQLYDRYVAPFHKAQTNQTQMHPMHPKKGPAVENPPRVVSVPK